MMAPELVIDRLFRQTFRKSHRNLVRVRADLLAARRFVLDDAMTMFMVELANERLFGQDFIKAKLGRSIDIDRGFRRICRMLDNMRYFSRLPHRVTWVEYSYEAFLRRQIKIAQDYEITSAAFMDPQGRIMQEHEMADRLAEVKGLRVAHLLKQIGKTDTSFDCMTFTADADPVVTFSPCAIAWDTEDSILPFELFDPEPEQSEYHSGAELATAVRGYVRKNVGFHLKHRPANNDFEAWQTLQAEMRQQYGHLRYLWAFLSTLNKIPLTGTQLVKPSRGFIARGSYHKFLEHSVITLHVPQKADRRILARKVLGDIIRRRAHQVRGHWRDDWRQPKGNKKLWIAEHQRGDASLGFVTHDYAVTHEANQ